MDAARLISEMRELTFRAIIILWLASEMCLLPEFEDGAGKAGGIPGITFT